MRMKNLLPLIALILGLALTFAWAGAPAETPSKASDASAQAVQPVRQTAPQLTPEQTQRLLGGEDLNAFETALSPCEQQCLRTQIRCEIDCGVDGQNESCICNCEIAWLACTAACP